MGMENIVGISARGSDPGAGRCGGWRAACDEAHRRYIRQVNLRAGWRIYLWQGRFASVAMDEPYLVAAAPLCRAETPRERGSPNGAGRARGRTPRGATTPWCGSHRRIAARAGPRLLAVVCR